MAVRKVLQLGDPVLRETCSEVRDASAPEIRALVEDLEDTLAHWRKTTGYGRGIAAPQIGQGRQGVRRVVATQLQHGFSMLESEILVKSLSALPAFFSCHGV